MATEDSILNSTKKILGLGDAYDAFDLDIMTHINTCFFTLNQLGIGPAEGFMIEGEEAVWVDFVGSSAALNAVKTYVYLRVRLFFDPPSAPQHVEAIKQQIEELTYRLLMDRELTAWVAPTIDSPSSPFIEELILDGGTD